MESFSKKKKTKKRKFWNVEVLSLALFFNPLNYICVYPFPRFNLSDIDGRPATRRFRLVMTYKRSVCNSNRWTWNVSVCGPNADAEWSIAISLSLLYVKLGNIIISIFVKEIITSENLKLITFVHRERYLFEEYLWSKKNQKIECGTVWFQFLFSFKYRHI